ncbi:MAG: redoxin domain-containing protein [Chitinophagaceae bacterium]
MIQFGFSQKKVPQKVSQKSSTNLKAIPKKTSTTTNGRNIAITVKPYKKAWVYLGSYYGKSKTLADSAFLDENSKGYFKGSQKLTPGIYFVVSPNFSILFEVLMDDVQQFTISADTLKLQEVSITGSLENDLFKNYSQFSAIKGKALADMNEAYSKIANTNKIEAEKLRIDIIKANKELQSYRQNIIQKYPKSLLATLFNTMKQPETPAIPVVNGKADSSYPYRYVKEHYWDDVAFNDDRLLRTPFFETKLDNYFKFYVPADPDSIFSEIKYMLLFARTGKEIYPYLLTKFTNKYINPEYMGQDKVFVKLFEEFYAKGDTVYLNAASRKTIIERAYSLMANQIGNPAPILELTGDDGKQRSLYDMKGKFTMVVFWDPSCGHCKEEVPRVDSIYKAKWKDLDVRLYSVNVSTAANTNEELKKFVQEKNFSSDWVYAYQTKAARDAEQKAGLPNYRQLYDVFKTPTLYLLNDKKQIIAKQLTIQQFDDLISAKLKQ